MHFLTSGQILGDKYSWVSWHASNIFKVCICTKQHGKSKFRIRLNFYSQNWKQVDFLSIHGRTAMIILWSHQNIVMSEIYINSQFCSNQNEITDLLMI